MDLPTYLPAPFFRLLQQQKETQLLLAALRLDLFSHLDHPRTAAEVASQLQCHPGNVEHALRALTAMELLEKQETRYCNTPAVSLYLSRDSELYLGEYFLFWEKKTSLCELEERIRLGPQIATPASHSFYDFHELARLSAIEIKTGRVQSFLRSTTAFFNKNSRLHILDLGGGSGGMAIEFIKEYPRATAVIFEHPAVADLPSEHVLKENLTSKISVMSGDFMHDPLGQNYDLVIASGIFDFAGDDLPELLEKLQEACSPQAYLYLVSHDVNDDLTAPKEAILGWLSSHLAGLRILRPKSTLLSALLTAGFTPIHKQEQKGAIQKLQGEWFQCVKSAKQPI